MRSFTKTKKTVCKCSVGKNDQFVQERTELNQILLQMKILNFLLQRSLSTPELKASIHIGYFGFTLYVEHSCAKL